VKTAPVLKIQLMKSIEEKLKSEQCRRILEALSSGAQTAEALVKLTRLSAGSVAKHLEVLEIAELVVRGRAGNYAIKR
jgi:DNA-binding transcriptional ArsR family regulator